MNVTVNIIVNNIMNSFMYFPQAATVTVVLEVGDKWEPVLGVESKSGHNLEEDGPGWIQEGFMDEFSPNVVTNVPANTTLRFSSDHVI